MIEKDILTILLVGLIVKHFVADFPLQFTWMAINKGTFLHPGGLVHSGIHAFGTLLGADQLLHYLTYAAIIYVLL